MAEEESKPDLTSVDVHLGELGNVERAFVETLLSTLRREGKEHCTTHRVFEQIDPNELSLLLIEGRIAQSHGNARMERLIKRSHSVQTS